MESLLKSGLDKLQIEATDLQIESILQFVNLLLKWNKVYNLTAIRNADDMIRLHILDSLSLLPYLDGAEKILDVGSGGGLPGVPLSILSPEKRFVLLDANGKKTRFIQQAIIELQLKNVKVAHSRVENYQSEELFDCITTRAFATIVETIKLTEHLLNQNAKLVCMKANTAELELVDIPDGYKKSIHTLKVPGIDAPRTLAVLSKIKTQGD